MEKIFHIIIVSLEYLVDTKHSTKGYSIFTVNLQYFGIDANCLLIYWDLIAEISENIFFTIPNEGVSSS